jgi:hypothetical protein
MKMLRYLQYPSIVNSILLYAIMVKWSIFPVRLEWCVATLPLSRRRAI